MAQVCNSGLLVAFNKAKFLFYCSADFTLPSESIVFGYCQGRIYYPPSRAWSSLSELSSCLSQSSLALVSDALLLTWYALLGHIEPWTPTALSNPELNSCLTVCIKCSGGWGLLCLFSDFIHSSFS